MSTWSPREMPKLRDQAIRTIATTPPLPPEGRRLLGGLIKEAPEGLVMEALPDARLFWVTPDMTELATSAGRSLPEIHLAGWERPARTGMMVFDGDGIPGTPLVINGDPQQPITIDPMPLSAVTWVPTTITTDDSSEMPALIIGWWTRTARFTQELGRHGRTIWGDISGQLVPAYMTLAVDRGHPVLATEMAPDQRLMMGTLQAAWHLMAQPSLAQDTPVEVDRKIRAAYARSQRPAPAVRLVDLRHTYRPSQPGQQGGRQYRHRWVVSGHWRDQPHGPARAERKRIWVASYVKGPDGAPILATEKVNVWRR